MRRVVLVAPEFPPANTAGAHRPRLFAKHLPSFGWNPIVLTIRLDQIEGPLDPTLDHLIDPGLSIIRTGALPIRPVRLIGDLGVRSLLNHSMALARLYRNREADAVVLFGPPWFSFLLGPFMWRCFKIPYIVDYIDPWISDWYASKPFPQKAWFYHRAAVVFEPIVLRSAAHVTAVRSGTYLELRQRYPWLKEKSFSAMPYGFESEDLEAAERLGVFPPDFSPEDGNLHICFTGAIQPRGGELLSSVLEAVKVLRYKHPAVGNRFRLHFYGTSNLTWGHGRYSVLPMAQKMGLNEVVSEIPERIPYLQSMAILRTCDVILVMGSWERFYHASKLYPAIASRKPILALCHKDSSMVGVMSETQAGKCVSFEGPEDVEGKVHEIAAALSDLLEKRRERTGPQENQFAKFSARSSTKVLAEALDQAFGIQ